MITPGLLVLADGDVYYGTSIGASGNTTGEVVFNTSIFGYQEIISDPSYAKQMVTLTHPHIGNVGVNDSDFESSKIWASGLICRDVPNFYSHWRANRSLPELLAAQGIVGITGIDTRRLTRKLRDVGVQNGCIMCGDNLDVDAGIALARKTPAISGTDLAKTVTTESSYQLPPLTNSATNESVRHVVVYDFGVKNSLLRILAEHGCALTVVPATTSVETVLGLAPDGIFLSNGPGDPEPCHYAIDAIKKFIELGIPLFGVCLGFQLLALACGASTCKMKFGHHGGNHPVSDLSAANVLITSQNHSFCVADSGLPPSLTVTHRSLFDGTLQGLHHQVKPAFGFQGHPEAGPGPNDALGLFKQFLSLIDKYIQQRNCQQSVLDDHTV